MPADSDHPSQIVLPHTWRPFGARIAASVAGACLLIVCLVAWFGFSSEIRAQFTPFQKLTMVGLFGIAFAAWFALVRSRVVAEETRLIVVNGYRRHVYDWAEVVSVNLLRGAPWATLDLADGTTMSALAIQGSDGDRARTAVRQLRSLLS
jgi:hypothetical protein